MSKMMNVCCCLSCTLLNQLMTDSEFFHWLRDVVFLIVVLIFSKICLLMRPISLFAGLINLHFGLFSKFSLWSLRVMNACRSAMRSALSWMLRSVAMFRASLLISWMVLSFAFL